MSTEPFEKRGNASWTNACMQGRLLLPETTGSRRNLLSSNPACFRLCTPTAVEELGCGVNGGSRDLATGVVLDFFLLLDVMLRIILDDPTYCIWMGRI